jgi:excisionase family DNA binding protein
METLLNIQELENVTSIRVSTLRKYVMLKKIPYVKIGRLLRFCPSDIEKWISSISHDVEVESDVPAHENNNGQLLFDAGEL